MKKLPLYEISTLADVKYIYFVMLAERLKPLGERYLTDLTYWAMEIFDHDFDNEGLVYISEIILEKYEKLFLALEETKKAKRELQAIWETTLEQEGADHLHEIEDVLNFEDPLSELIDPRVIMTKTCIFFEKLGGNFRSKFKRLSTI